VAKVTATRTEIVTSMVILAVRYSQKRSGVETMAAMVRSCLSKNTAPPMKKNPMIEMSPRSTYGPATERSGAGIGSKMASPSVWDFSGHMIGAV
jgi:hypothetical protein